MIKITEDDIANSELQTILHPMLLDGLVSGKVKKHKQFFKSIMKSISSGYFKRKPFILKHCPTKDRIDRKMVAFVYGKDLTTVPNLRYVNTSLLLFRVQMKPNAITSLAIDLTHIGIMPIEKILTSVVKIFDKSELDIDIHIHINSLEDIKKLTKTLKKNYTITY